MDFRCDFDTGDLFIDGGGVQKTVYIPQGLVGRTTDPTELLVTTDVSTCCIVIFMKGDASSLSHLHQNIGDRKTRDIIKRERKWVGGKPGLGVPKMYCFLKADYKAFWSKFFPTEYQPSVAEIGGDHLVVCGTLTRKPQSVSIFKLQSIGSPKDIGQLITFTDGIFPYRTLCYFYDIYYIFKSGAVDDIGGSICYQAQQWQLGDIIKSCKSMMDLLGEEVDDAKKTFQKLIDSSSGKKVSTVSLYLYIFNLF